MHRNQLGDCAACGKKLGEWSPTSGRVDVFLDKVEEYVQQGANWAVPAIPFFRDHVHRREQAGRKTFDHRFLTRDNTAEALEEAVDLALYACLEELRLLREGCEEDVQPFLLLAAFHAAQSYAACQQAIATRAGSPGVRVDE
jgi:hypothetical protein